jgi:hypothetical protein
MILDGKFAGSTRPGVIAKRAALRIAAWISLATIISVAFHYAKKYEADMLTDAGSEMGTP